MSKRERIYREQVLMCNDKQYLIHKCNFIWCWQTEIFSLGIHQRENTGKDTISALGVSVFRCAPMLPPASPKCGGRKRKKSTMQTFISFLWNISSMQLFATVPILFDWIAFESIRDINPELTFIQNGNSFFCTIRFRQVCAIN